MRKVLALSILSSLFLTACPIGDTVAPYCPAAEVAVGLICGNVLPVVLGDPESGDFDGTTSVMNYNTLILQAVGPDGELRPVCLGEGCPDQ